MHGADKAAFDNSAHLIDHTEMMRILGRIPPVETGAGRPENATFGRGAYSRHQSAPRARVVRDADAVGFDFAARRPKTQRRVWALIPNATLIGEAVTEGRGPELVAQWDELTRTAPWSTLAAAYGAAHEARPGGAVEAHHRAKAASGGFDIVPADRAIELRDKLLAASTPGGCVDFDL
ncbi:hypothetical protein [Limimaricola pyoseonensis]|uniref:Uncharacterized protein n=1 Tax=Limimaricola pyoseonensis TaxID=521013 RepID=A0A1G7BWV3_9RHOB|nr:hypothetical protein [Limimaricola pyoseonensis]SDE31598.1 hypothetical protein SAMN04488567_1270 [Limimaricola pyoseonensis]